MVKLIKYNKYRNNQVHSDFLDTLNIQLERKNSKVNRINGITKMVQIASCCMKSVQNIIIFLLMRIFETYLSAFNSINQAV